MKEDSFNIPSDSFFVKKSSMTETISEGNIFSLSPQNPYTNFEDQTKDSESTLYSIILGFPFTLDSYHLIKLKNMQDPELGGKECNIIFGNPEKIHYDEPVIKLVFICKDNTTSLKLNDYRKELQSLSKNLSIEFISVFQNKLFLQCESESETNDAYSSLQKNSTLLDFIYDEEKSVNSLEDPKKEINYLFSSDKKSFNNNNFNIKNEQLFIGDILSSDKKEKSNNQIEEENNDNFKETSNILDNENDNETDNFNTFSDTEQKNIWNNNENINNNTNDSNDIKHKLNNNISIEKEKTKITENKENSQKKNLKAVNVTTNSINQNQNLNQKNQKAPYLFNQPHFFPPFIFPFNSLQMPKNPIYSQIKQASPPPLMMNPLLLQTALTMQNLFKSQQQQLNLNLNNINVNDSNNKKNENNIIKNCNGKEINNINNNNNKVNNEIENNNNKESSTANSTISSGSISSKDSSPSSIPQPKNINNDKNGINNNKNNNVGKNNSNINNTNNMINFNIIPNLPNINFALFNGINININTSTNNNFNYNYNINTNNSKNSTTSNNNNNKKINSINNNINNSNSNLEQIVLNKQYKEYIPKKEKNKISDIEKNHTNTNTNSICTNNSNNCVKNTKNENDDKKENENIENMESEKTGVDFHTNSTRDYQLKYVSRYIVQIENEKNFPVTKMIIGNKGELLRQILLENCINYGDHTTKIRLRGKGSGYKEGPKNEESKDPMELCISSLNMFSYCRCSQAIENLLLNVYYKYYLYQCTNNGININNINNNNISNGNGSLKKEINNNNINGKECLKDKNGFPIVMKTILKYPYVVNRYNTLVKEEKRRKKEEEMKNSIQNVNQKNNLYNNDNFV